MMGLDLAACPICQARGGLARETSEIDGTPRVTYECLECGSVLLWLGDDLWLEADRWAYQKVGRAEKAYLLHRTLTADELRELAGNDRRPTYKSHAPVASTQPSTVSAQPPAASRGQSTSFESAGDSSRPGKGTKLRKVRRAAPVVGPTAPAAPAQPRRSRGSPFLVISVLLVLLCMIVAAAAMIAANGLNSRTPSGTASTDMPLSGPVQASLLPTETPLPTEAPLPTETPLPTDTPVPAATELPAVLLQGVTDYRAGMGTYYVLGEVLNTTGENLRFVEILATLYDSNDQVVGTGSTFSELSIVEAGQTAPFKLAVMDPPPSLATYKLRLDYMVTGEDLLRLEVLSHNSYADENGRYRISGEVRNPQGVAIKFPEIVATYYNAANQVVRVEVAFAQSQALQPGEVSPFEVVLVDPPGDLDHYALQTEAAQE